MAALDIELLQNKYDYTVVEGAYTKAKSQFVKTILLYSSEYIDFINGVTSKAESTKELLVYIDQNQIPLILSWFT